MKDNEIKNIPFTAFCCALTTMLFNSEFLAWIEQREFGRACAFAIAVWFGFFIFSCICHVVAVALIEKVPRKLERFKTLFKYLSAVIVFCAAHYIGQNFI